jgi:hypothetical protein
MQMRSLFAFATLTVLLSGNLIAPASAQQLGGPACKTPGTAILAGIPTARSALLPSSTREIVGYGRQALASSCLVEIVCIPSDSGDIAREVAGKQCVVVRDQLVRSGYEKTNIDTSRKNPGSGRTAGMVYLTLR